jgi:transposase
MTLSTSTMERAHDELMDDAPSLPAKPERRKFSAAYKLAILDKYEACTGDGDKGALLRREGLYSSQVTEWRRWREAGALGDQPRRNQPRRDQPRPLSAELVRATRRAERAEAKLAKAQKVIEIQGKVSELLEQLLAESTTEDKQSRS